MGRLDPFVAQVWQTIRRYELISPGETVIVALSGGPDSVALLAALHELAERGEFRLLAAHLDHGLRGTAARGDADYAAQLAASFDIPFQLRRCDVAALARSLGTSVEAAGRHARYDFMRELAQTHAPARIAVGHHRDDQVETVLINLLAGAGSDGVAGMQPRYRLVIRPLYDVNRADVLAFLARRRLQYRSDATNTDPMFIRNRVRTELLPLIRERFNPRFDEAVWRMSRLLADEVAYMEGEAERAVVDARLDLPNAPSFNAEKLQSLPSPLLRRALRQIFWQVANEPAPPLTAKHVALLVAMVHGGPPIDLPGGVRAVREHNVVRFYEPGAATASSGPGASTLTIPGVVVWQRPWPALAAELMPGPLAKAALDRPGHAFFDYDGLGRPSTLLVRTWRAGDHMRPLGAPGRRKLQDLFVDSKVPKSLRSLLPIVTLPEPRPTLAGSNNIEADDRVDDQIIWVTGIAIADQFRVRTDTRTVLHLFIEA